MNRSRMVAAGTSVGALIAITAGVAAANPAPTRTSNANRVDRTAPTSRGDGRTVPPQGDIGADDGADQWRQLPLDPSVTDPGFRADSGADVGQPPPFDPGAGSSGPADTSSGGS